MQDHQDLELYPILSVLDDSVPPGLAGLPMSLREAIFMGTDWVTEVIAGRHPSRKGPMCPFVPKAIDANRILFGIEQEPCADVEAQKRRFLSLADRYLGEPPLAGSKEMLTTLLIMYPDEDTDADDSVVGQAMRDLKTHFLQSRRMIGIFAFEWADDEESADGRPDGWRNPMPVLAMRHLVQGDDFFLKTNESAMAIYHRYYPR